MTENTNLSDIRSAWQAEETDVVELTAEELRSRIDRVSRRASRRAIQGVIAGAFVLLSFGYTWRLTASTEAFVRASLLVTYVGMAVFGWQVLSHRNRQKQDGSGMSGRGGAPTLEFHRYQLERQRDFHRGPRLWNRLLALASGPLLFCAGVAHAHPEIARAYYLNAAAIVVLCALAIPLNLRFARRYQDQLDSLTRLS